jgi:hypothetical protein
MTKGKFGFHQGGGKHEPSPAASYVQDLREVEHTQLDSGSCNLSASDDRS